MHELQYICNSSILHLWNLCFPPSCIITYPRDCTSTWIIKQVNHGKILTLTPHQFPHPQGIQANNVNWYTTFRLCIQISELTNNYIHDIMLQNRISWIKKMKNYIDDCLVESGFLLYISLYIINYLIKFPSRRHQLWKQCHVNRCILTFLINLLLILVKSKHVMVYINIGHEYIRSRMFLV